MNQLRVLPKSGIYRFHALLPLTPHIFLSKNPSDRYENILAELSSVCPQFIAHANVQQLLGTVWYDGMPGFRRKSMLGQLTEIGKIGAMFPVYSSMYMASPHSSWGQHCRKPFVKFIIHSSSYMFFLCKYGLFYCF